MARKKTKKRSKKVVKPTEEPVQSLEEPIQYEVTIPEEEPQEVPKEGKFPKTLVLILLAIIAIALLYYFINLPKNTFVPGTAIDQEAFKEIFNSAEYVYIVMDVRGVDPSSTTHQNILQCGIDFAGSSGFGPKNTDHFSISDEGCVTIDGFHDSNYCFSQLINGVTIYIHEGSETTLHNNGMSVGVGPDYTIGTCGIHRV
ncbi:hypothetical protein KKB44_04200 [Candidatus Micrarchaeota archaeon]|nr:hypothetical protein [Candidatus Micrarchaeota archaeon]